MSRFSCIFLLLALVLSGCSSELSHKFRELDRTISERGKYRIQLEEKADSLRRVMSGAGTDSARWEYSEQLFRLFKYWQADSALRYLDMMDSYADGNPAKTLHATLERSMVEVLMRKYSEAESMLNQVDTASLTQAELAAYYKADLYLDGIKAVDEMIPAGDRKRIVERRHIKRLAYINNPEIEPFELIRRNGMQLYESGHAKEATVILRDLVDNSESIEDKSEAAYSLAFAYAYTGDREKREYWLAQSAIYSMAIPIRASLALFELSNMLFEDNQLGIASRYCQVALEDALSSKYNSRIMNSANSMLYIVQAVGRKTRQDKSAYICIILVLGLLFAATVVLLVLSFRQHNTIKLKNRLLEDANEAKTEYITRHITMSSYYMEDIERYRHELRSALKEGGVDAVKEMLRKPPEDVVDYKTFFKIFDDTFLGLYPDFPDKVNALLKPDSRFILKNQGELTTGLRILAAIRIGITDSGKIAKFLHCAPSSVYTHRCKIKKRAVCPPEEFESRISQI